MKSVYRILMCAVLEGTVYNTILHRTDQDGVSLVRKGEKVTSSEIGFLCIVYEHTVLFRIVIISFLL